AQAAVVGDHAKPGHEAKLRAAHCTSAGLARELADRFGHAEKPTGRAGLADRELPATCVVGKAAVVRHRVRTHEGGAATLVAEAQVLELEHHYDRVIVVGLHEVHVG